MSGKYMHYKDNYDWNVYKEGRPEVPDSYFNRILEYHAQHGGEFNTWHDMGAGNAVHTERLAPKFKTTIVSDSVASNVEAARSHLGENGAYKFRVAKGEEAADLEPNSVDLVFGANMLHYTDVDETIRAVIHQLKPGGTLALGGFGLPILLDPKLHELWSQVIHRRLELMFELNRVAMDVCIQASSPHDPVSFDGPNFQPGAIRMKFNERNGWTWRRCMVPPSLDTVIPHVKRFGEKDVLVYEDNDDWNFEADITVMRKILGTFPLPPDPVRDDLWRKLEEAFGDKKVPATWPSSLTLVTKK